MAETALRETRPLLELSRYPAGDALAQRLAGEWLAALGSEGQRAGAGSSGGLLDDDISGRIVLTDLASRLLSILFATPFEPEAAALAGGGLVAAGFTGADVLGNSLRVLMLWLPTVLAGGAAAYGTALASRMAEVTGAFADGYARALRDRAVAETDSLRRAELDAERVVSSRLRHQATHDPLTGLPNRAAVFARLSAALSAGPGARVGLCYLDLDGFKGVNDSFGHAAGDQLLTVVAERIGRVAGQRGAVAARIGGDEFVVLAERSRGLTGMIMLAVGIQAEARRPVALPGGVVSVSACAGIVDCAAGGSTAESVVGAADAALYEAKSRGADRWAVHNSH